ncbi:Hsp20/alpha crystallin family protein [Bacillus tianshenii]|uniref:Hsp20/alpha crystallin family protein n=1 Tax=Sutcliffiella tianshenii TaxID=1463404 RepID=UPI001CD1D76A|nr:Hsp20/alpha crystallin family protein [Bacillus tianshenii]MCA1319171.1 Hsp20/alpha crystallin family protein [Bacillus tianshenii]
MNKKSRQGNPWENMNEKIDDVLGEKFWKDVLPVIPKRVPLVDIYETPSYGYMILELPGLHSTKDVEITVQNNQLFIKGTIPYPYQLPKENLLQSERFFGTFKRAIAIPFSFVPQKLTAQYKQGVLLLAFQKADHDIDVEIDFQD